MGARIVASFVFALTVAIALTGGALAQSYPNKPIRWIIPYPPGGGTDAIGRIVGERLGEILGVPVITVNQTGASGTIGSDFVRRAEADGYTLLFNASVFTLGRGVVKSTPYEPLEDFTTVARIGEVPLILIASQNVEGSSIGEVVQAARANPNRFNFAISALGSAGHVATLEFLRQAGAKAEIIPYRGAAPALTDLAAGVVQLMIDPLTVLLPQVQGGRAKPLAVTGRERSPLAPNVPTTAEAGMPGLVMASWYGVWGPKNLPSDVVQRLSTSLEEVAKDRRFLARVESLGIKPTFMGPGEAEVFMRAEAEKSMTLLRAANFVPD